MVQNYCVWESEPVNPQLHDEFLAMCALFASGELTDEEWALLQVHLAYCDSCRVAFEDFQQISQDVVPAMAMSAVSEHEPRPQETPFSVEAAENAMFARLDALHSKPQPIRSPRPKWPLYAGLAACAVASASIIGVHLLRTKTPRTTPTMAVEAPPVHSHQQPPGVPLVQHAEQPLQTMADAGQVNELRRQLKTTQELYHQSTAEVASIQEGLNAEQLERQRISTERDAVQQQLLASQTEEQSLRQNLQATAGAGREQATQTEVLNAKVHQLTADLEEKDKLLRLDKEFLAHDREIRDLIGARNLYIADIYDVGQNGKTAKPFGRIFYTKDRSLVFYGYDLDQQPGLKQSVAFQAWGSGDDKQNVSLGLFYQDDTHKRWVLRFNDTKTLARLNMVFVTAEPRGGSTKPTGKPVLLAYLQVQPNHP